MENIDTAQKNQHLLLDLLMDSMPKTPEAVVETQGERVSAPETVKTESQGDKIDLLA
ncbi:MAG: hypothetical protein LBT68_01925 [Spirochaetales bacterium]|jgi:hypothetical protein|nr:hypothetical protein [Spirochaetales bacterium]